MIVSKLPLFCLAAALFLLCHKSFAIEADEVRKSVYKVRVVSQDPSFSHPWLSGNQKRGSGTGFYIGKGRILTNAHVVANGRYITVQRDGDDQPVNARITFIANDNDLAILETDEKDFFKDSEPLTFGSMPKLRQTVATIGYPKGGEQISITEGVVSRIGYRRYTHSGYHKHILIQVDSAINPGNSGGPVMQGDQVVGVAFQAHTKAENTGYIIPTPVIKRFLKDIEDGSYDGHPDAGLVLLKGGLSNQAMRKYHRLKKEDGGIKVTYVFSYTPTHTYIKENDILLKIDGYAIGVDGKVAYEGERVNFKALFDLKQMGETADFTLSRDGKTIEVSVPIKPNKRHHYMANIYPKFPRFYIYSGLVFTPLSRDYLKVWGSKWYRDAPIAFRYMHWYSQTEPRFRFAKELVVLSLRLPDPINVDASYFREGLVDKINDTPINKLEDVEAAIAATKSKYVAIHLWNQPIPLLLPKEEAKRYHSQILSRYGVFPKKWLSGNGLIFEKGAAL